MRAEHGFSALCSRQFYVIQLLESDDKKQVRANQFVVCLFSSSVLSSVYCVALPFEWLMLVCSTTALRAGDVWACLVSKL